MGWQSSLFAVAVTAVLATSAAHASVLLTPSNPVAFGAYPAPIFVGLESAQNDGFIIIEFADSLFGADDQLRVRGFSTTDASGAPYLDALLSGPEDNLLIYGNVPHTPSPGSVLVSLSAGDYANLLQFRVGYHDDVGQEFETLPAVAFEAAVPTPPTLPLFATGLGLMGLLGWRKRSKRLATLISATSEQPKAERMKATLVALLLVTITSPATATVVETWQGTASGTDFWHWTITDAGFNNGDAGLAWTDAPYQAVITYDCVALPCTEAPTPSVTFTILGTGIILNLIDEIAGDTFANPDEIAATAIGEARNGSHFPEIFTQDMLPGGGTGQLLYGSQDFYPSTASPLSLILTPTSVMVNGELLTLSVPEPSTLGLIGLGLLGLAAMRRRQVCT